MILFALLAAGFVCSITYLVWTSAPETYITQFFATAFIIAAILFLLNAVFDGAADRIGKRLERQEKQKRLDDYEEYIGRYERTWNCKLDDTERQRMWDEYYE